MRLTPTSHNRTPTRRPRHGCPARAGRLLRGVGIVCALATAVVLSLVTSATAQPPAPEAVDQVVAVADSVDEVLGNIRDWLMGILAALATVFLTIGGVLYMMAGGDPGQVERGKTAFKAAGIGYGLAALAPLVVQVLEGIVGA